ncbi:hypothetical protein [Trichothermofontia sp.]
MGLPFTELGADILWVEGLLDPLLCQHLIQVAETCQLAQAGIEVARLDNQIRSNDLLDWEAITPCWSQPTNCC